MDGQNQKLLVDQLRRVFSSSDRSNQIGSDWLRGAGKLLKLDFMYGDETEIVFINSMKDSFEKCCRFTSITNLHDKYGHGNKLIYPILFDPYYMGHIMYGPYSF